MSENGKTHGEGMSEEGVFFLRHNNDFDHFAPIIFKWSFMEARYATIIYDDNTFKVDDLRCKFLSSHENVRFFSYDHVEKSVKKEQNEKKGREERFIDCLISKFCFNCWRKIFVFDHTLSRFSAGAASALRGYGYSSISLPHGDDFYRNYLITKDDFEFAGLNLSRQRSHFDFLVTASRKQDHRCRSSVPDDRRFLLGSSRYCEEWIAQLDQVLPKIELGNGDNNLNIAIFLRNAKYAIFWDEFVALVNMVLRFPNVCVVLVEHPRIYQPNGVRRQTQQITIDDVPDRDSSSSLVRVNAEEYNSFQIVEWADAVFSLGTSAVYDAILKGKPVFEMDYLHPNRTLVADIFKNSDIKCRDDILIWMRRLVQGGGNVESFYRAEELQSFRENVINPKGGDILLAYTDLLCSLAKNPQVI